MTHTRLYPPLYRLFPLLAMLVMLLLAGTAFAQAELVPGLPSLDPSKLATDFIALGVTVVFVVQFLKRQFERKEKPFQPWMTLVLGLVLCEAASAALFYARYGATYGDLAPPWGWIVFGFMAWLVGAGARDWFVSQIERRNGTTEFKNQTLPPDGVIEPAYVPGDTLPENPR